MIRLFGIVLDDRARVEAGLTKIFGIGRSNVKIVLGKAGVDPDIRIAKLDQSIAEKIKQAIDSTTKVEGDLKTEISGNIKRLKEIGSYRGYRHVRALPVRGQRTKTNARTKRGKRVTVGSGRKKSVEKT